MASSQMSIEDIPGLEPLFKSALLRLQHCNALLGPVQTGELLPSVLCNPKASRTRTGYHWEYIASPTGVFPLQQEPPMFTTFLPGCLPCSPPFCLDVAARQLFPPRAQAERESFCTSQSGGSRCNSCMLCESHVQKAILLLVYIPTIQKALLQP